MRIALPAGCRGIDDPRTGRTYRPSKPGGSVVVDDPIFARSAKRELGEIGTMLFMSSSMPSWSCECGRTNWEKDDTCRRCGRKKP